MVGEFTYDVFLSHNSHDKPRVRRLAERMQDAGLRVWFDEWAIKPGDDIYLAIERGLEAARIQVLCLSPAALASDWVVLERSTVLFRDPTNTNRRFIPLLLADCTLPATLRRYLYVDFRSETEAAFAQLVAACRPGMEAEPPSREPEAKVKATKKPAKKAARRRKPRPAPAPEQAAPLAVFERTLTGHSKWVMGVAISPDGRWMASGSDDNTVRIWDLVKGECRTGLDANQDMTPGIAITPDGQVLLSAAQDYSVRVWNAASGDKLTPLQGHTDRVWSVIAMPDNKRALSGGLDRTLRLWEIASGQCLKLIHCGENEADHVFSSAVNAAGTQALSGHRDGQIRLWSLETGNCLAILEGHSDIAHSVQIMPDGQFAASGSRDQTVKIWDLNAGICIGTLEGHENACLSIAVSPDGSLIASAGFVDNTVRLWDWKSGTCLQTILLEKGNYFPLSVAFSQTGSRLFTGTTAGEIHVYRLRDARPAPVADAARRYVNAKIVLIGEGTAGKTSLAHRLIDDEYVVRDRTHGMSVWPLDLPLAPDSTLEREALLWDLAGQEDYRLIHQLFLDQTALALLLVNPQKDDPFIEAGDWLKALKTATSAGKAGQQTAQLLVFSHIDVGGMKLGNAKIDRFCDQYGFAGWIATSAKTGENCSDGLNGGQPSALKQLIADTIPWDKLPWTSTPRLLAALKTAVMTMRDEADIRLLRFSELEQRLKYALPEETFAEPDVRTAVTLLANHGLVRPLEFGDLILLRPDLLNGYAGAIIRAARAHKDEIGCVREGDIYLPQFDFTGLERLNHRPDEELLLRAMVQTLLDNALCIAEDTPAGRLLVFPSQYRRERDIPREPNTFVSYSFSGEWQTIWTTLVVRLWYSQEFGHRELWRNAAEFSSSKGHTLGLMIDNRQGEGEATIRVFFDAAAPDELKVIFIEYLHRHLDKYACNVVRDRRYVCAKCGKLVTDLDAVRQRLTNGKNFITCQGCDDRVELIDHIEQRLKSDPVAQKILQMERTATRELDTQALEQILIGHMMSICGEASQIFRPVTMFDYGIDGEVEFKDNNGQASGKKIYVQLKSGNSYLRTRRSDGYEIFDIKNERHLEYWQSQPVDVYLVIRQKDEATGQSVIRWINVTSYLKNRKDKESRQIIFDGRKLDMEAVWTVRDEFFPPHHHRPIGRT